MVQEDVLWKHVQTSEPQKTKNLEIKAKQKNRRFRKEPGDVSMASQIKSSNSWK